MRESREIVEPIKGPRGVLGGGLSGLEGPEGALEGGRCAKAGKSSSQLKVLEVPEGALGVLRGRLRGPDAQKYGNRRAN